MNDLKRNLPNQNVKFVLVNSELGNALLGAVVSVYVTKDNGIQAAGMGVVSELGNGQYNYSPAQAETNALDVGFLFLATNAVPVNYDFHTSSFQGNVPNQNMTFVLVNASSGNSLIGASVIAYVTKDSGTQTTGLGTITECGHGQYNYSPAQLETDATDVAFLFEASEAVPVTYDFHPSGQRPIQSAGLIQYASRVQAQMYFDGHLGTRAWDRASPMDQNKSLIQATTAIDKLRFRGEKWSRTQLLEFPRKYEDRNWWWLYTGLLNLTYFDEILIYEYPNLYVKQPTNCVFVPGATPPIPTNIMYATAETALQFLAGRDPEKEAREIFLEEQHFTTIRTKRDIKVVDEWTLAGIPSVTAWNFIKPYLADPLAIDLCRVD
jgi:hypothetical protein